MSSSVPLKPLGREDIRKLEMALLLTALYSKETLEAIKGEERLTWIDSLYVAAASLAREKAGMPVSKIADEVGVTEATVRRHLRGETKAGELIKEAYRRLEKEGFKLELPSTEIKCEEKLQKVKKMLEDVLKELSSVAEMEKAVKALQQAVQELSS